VTQQKSAVAAPVRLRLLGFPHPVTDFAVTGGLYAAVMLRATTRAYAHTYTVTVLTALKEKEE
jgi:hypothetical protein